MGKDKIEKEEKNNSQITNIVFIIVLFVVAFLGTYLGNSYYDKQRSNRDVTKKEEVKKDETKEEVEEETEDKGKIEIYYDEEKKEFKSDDGKLVITNSIRYPKTITIEATAEDKIKTTLKKIADSKFSTVNNQAQEQIVDYNKYKTGFADKFGVSYVFSERRVDYEIISFALNTSGSMGGTGWAETEYYNYSFTTGEQLKLEDICIDVTKCKEVMIDFFLKELEKDERFSRLYEDYKDVVKEKLFANNSWGYNNVGMNLVIDKYEIASGAEGIFEYVMPKEELNGYLKDGYKCN